MQQGGGKQGRELTGAKGEMMGVSPTRKGNAYGPSRREIGGVD